MRTIVDFRTYYEIVSDLVGLLHLQGGEMFGFTKGPNGKLNYVACSTTSRWPELGARLSTRRLRTARHHARHVRGRARRYVLWGASLEVQYPFYFLPKDAGFRSAVFVDFGAKWGYKGETSWPSNGEVNGLITTSTGTSYVCGNCDLLFADTAAPRRWSAPA